MAADEKRISSSMAQRSDDNSYQMLLDAMPQIVFLADADGRCVFANRAWAEIAAKPPAAAVGDGWIAAVHPDDRADVSLQWRQLISTGEPWTGEYRCGSADRTWHWLRATASPVRDQHGSCTGFVVVNTDITGQKASEEEFRRNAAETARALLNVNQDAVLLVGIDGKVIDANEQMAKRYGVARENLIGQNSLSLMADAANRRKSWREEILSRKEPLFREEAVGDRILENSIYPILDAAGDVQQLAIFSRDITDRKRAEEAVRRSEDRYRAIAEAIPDMLFRIRRDGTLTDFVPSALEGIVPYVPAEELLGRKITDVLPAPVGEELLGVIQRAIAAGSPQTRRYHLPERIGAPQLESGNRIFEGRAVPSGPDEAFWHVRDITEAKAMEQRLRQAEKMEAIGTLAGGIAHDFNNILQAIIGTADLAVQGVDPQSKTHKYLTRIVASGNRAAELVGQILAFSQPADKDNQVLRLTSVITDLQQLLRPSLPSSIKIELDTRHFCRPIWADASEMSRLLTNLCTNSARAMEEYGGILTIALREVKLDSSLAARLDLPPGASYARLTVRDTGAGMDADVLSRAFDPFFSTQVTGQSTGMGLSIVHGIVKRCAGAVAIESEVGKGTTVEVYLPITELAPEARAADEIGVGARRGSENVLFVDDEELIVAYAEEALGGFGYQVEGHTSSTEALAAFCRSPERYDAVITDQTMPDLSGAKLVSEILAIRPGLPVIVCTGHSDIVRERMAAEFGIHKFLKKPLLADTLALALRRALDGT